MQKDMQLVLAGPHLTNSNHVSLHHSASRSPCSKTGVRREHALTRKMSLLMSRSYSWLFVECPALFSQVPLGSVGSLLPVVDGETGAFASISAQF